MSIEKGKERAAIITGVLTFFLLMASFSLDFIASVSLPYLSPFMSIVVVSGLIASAAAFFVGNVDVSNTMMKQNCCDGKHSKESHKSFIEKSNNKNNDIPVSTNIPSKNLNNQHNVSAVKT